MHRDIRTPRHRRQQRARSHSGRGARRDRRRHRDVVVDRIARRVQLHEGGAAASHAGRQRDQHRVVGDAQDRHVGLRALRRDEERHPQPHAHGGRRMGWRRHPRQRVEPADDVARVGAMGRRQSPPPTRSSPRSRSATSAMPSATSVRSRCSWRATPRVTSPAASCSPTADGATCAEPRGPDSAAMVGLWVQRA